MKNLIIFLLLDIRIAAFLIQENRFLRLENESFQNNWILFQIYYAQNLNPKIWRCILYLDQCIDGLRCIHNVPAHFGVLTELKLCSRINRHHQIHVNIKKFFKIKIIWIVIWIFEWNELREEEKQRYRISLQFFHLLLYRIYVSCLSYFFPSLDTYKECISI